MADLSISPLQPELPSVRTSPLKPGTILPEAQRDNGNPVEMKEMSFRDSIRNFVHDVDAMQKDSAKKVQDFMAGEITDVHDVMLAVEKAGTSFQLLMELRNKMMDAYQEIKRMSI